MRSLKSNQQVPLLKTYGLLRHSVQPVKTLADLKTDGLSRVATKPNEKLTGLKTDGLLNKFV